MRGGWCWWRRGDGDGRGGVGRGGGGAFELMVSFLFVLFLGRVGRCWKEPGKGRYGRGGIS